LTDVKIRCAIVPKNKKLDLVGVAEIATMVGVSRQRIDQIIRTHADFPPPVAELVAGRIWLRSDVQIWARRRGRNLH
jgi:predicted DNA-binding transcriptional regulator AlpA